MKIRNQAYAGKELFFSYFIFIFQWKRRSISKTANLYALRQNKKYLFLLKLSLNIQMFQSLMNLFRLSFSNCVSCRRHYEEVKNTSNALGPSAVTLKMVIGIKRPFLLWKFIENEQKLWYLKGKRHFALRRTSVWMR